MTRKPAYDISDEGQLAMWAGLAGWSISALCKELRALPVVDCNAHCRKIAQELLEELGPHLTDWDVDFFRSILAWHDRRRLSAKQIKMLYGIGCIVARRVLAAERRALRCLAIVMPANTLPA